MRRTVLLIAAAMSLCATAVTHAWLDPADPDVVVVLDSADNQFCWHGGPGDQTEWLRNKGGATRIRLNGWEDIAGFKFDLSAYRGRTVLEAELHLAKADSYPIYALVAATINNDWNEGTTSSGDAKVGESCWRWRSRPADPNNADESDEWTFPHSDFSVASFGNYGSLVCYAYKANGTFGTYTSGGYTWLRMKLAPDVVHALILDQYGLAVTDPRGYTLSHPRVYTKEQGPHVQPRLYIKFSPSLDTTPPEPVTDLSAQAGPEDGQVALTFKAPVDPKAPAAFGYTVRYSTVNDFDSAADLARWRIPRPATPGTPQKVLIENLSPSTTYYFFVQAYDRAGNGSPVASVAFTLPPAEPSPVLPDAEFNEPPPQGKTVRTVGNVLRYWACSEVTKVNPVTGNRMQDGYFGTGADDYKKANVVWDSQTNTIGLIACRNEVVGCQIILERLGSALTDVSVTVSDLVGPAGSTIPAHPYIELFQLHYVRSGAAFYPDAAIPLAEPFPTTFSIPDASHNPTGRNQSVWLDLYVPKDAAPGQYSGLVTVEAAELPEPVTINLKVKVSPIEIPDFPTFLIDLNGYGTPWGFGDVPLTRLRYFQICHKHRMVPNTVPYSQSGAVRDTDRMPDLAGAGPNLHVASWERLDQAYGPLLDGSAFTPDNPDSPYVGPGMNTPIATLYTPIFDSWPVSLLDPDYGYDADGMGPEYWQNLLAYNRSSFWSNAPDVWDAFNQGYRQGVQNIVKEWFEHAQAKGWHQTNFQIYLNNKYKNRTPPATFWILEECQTADDFRAVGFFHTLYRAGQALADAPDVRWHFRIDISSRWGENYGQLDNLINWVCMNIRIADWHWPNIKYRNIILNEAERWAWYGTGPAPQDSGLGHARTFLRQWAHGLDGGLPYWNCFKTSWGMADALSVLYSGQNIPGFGTYHGAIASIRMKMMRQAEQIIELLNLLAQQPGWNRNRVTQALVAKYGTSDWTRSFDNLSEVDLYRLRADLIAELELFWMLPGDINGDGRVDLTDLLEVVNAFGLSEAAPGYNPAADLNDDGTIDMLDLLKVVENFGVAM